MGRPPLTILALLAITPLVACSTTLGVDGFTDLAAKERVWEVRKCNIFANTSAEKVKLELTQLAYSGDLPREDEIKAMEWVVTLSDAVTVADVMPVEDRDGMTNICSGWLWEHHKETDPHYKTGFDDFTAEDAKEEGLFGDE